MKKTLSIRQGRIQIRKHYETKKAVNTVKIYKSQSRYQLLAFDINNLMM